MWTLYLALLVAAPADWPRFRGPNGSGVSDTTALPAEFGREKNLVWRAAVPPGGSSPVVAGNRVYITAYEDTKRSVLCFDASSGKLLWRRDTQKSLPDRRSKPNDPATPTPVSDGAYVYALFPDVGLLSYSSEGRERWRASLGALNPPHGFATSPILAGGNVIVAVDQVAESFVAAFNAETGKPVWKSAHASFIGGYSTPITHDGGQVVVSSPLALTAYSAATGAKLWSAPRTGLMPIGVPIFGDGVFFVNNGSVPSFNDLAVTFKADKNNDGKLSPDEFPDPAFREAVIALDRNADGGIDAQEWNGALQRVAENSLLAVEPGGKRERWRITKGLSDVPSPLFYKDGLYLVKDGGIVTRIDPRTGAAVKQTRLTGALDKYFASPVAGDGKIYFTSQAGKIAVVKAGGDLDILAVNDLGEECYATPAIASGGLYVRTAEALYFFASRSAG